MAAPCTIHPDQTFELDVRLLRFWNMPGSVDPATLCRDLVAADRVDEALQLTGAGLRSNPQDAPLRLARGIAYLRRGELARAQSMFTQAAHTSPGWAEPWAWLAKLLIQRSQYRRASGVLEHARALGAPTEELESLTRTAMRQDELSRRLERFQKHPASEEPTMLAQQLLAVGRVNEALDVTTVALDVDKDDPDLLVVHGHALQAGGYPALARIAFERTVRVAPEWNKPWRELAYLLLELGKLEQAGRVLDRALERHYGDESVWELCDRLVARVLEHAAQPKDPSRSPAPRRTGAVRGSSRGYDPRRSGRYHPPTPAELFPGSLGGTDTAPVLD